MIFLHKPFDAMTIGMLMARGGYSLAWRHTVNGLFSLAIPLGVLVFYFGLMSLERSRQRRAASIVAYALAFSAGTFLCISSSDLLPELQFHQHDRVKLSAALLLGLAVAIGVAELEAATHGPHSHAAPASRRSIHKPTQLALPVKLSRSRAGLRGATRNASPRCLTVASVVSVESASARRPNG